MGHKARFLGYRFSLGGRMGATGFIFLQIPAILSTSRSFRNALPEIGHQSWRNFLRCGHDVDHVLIRVMYNVALCKFLQGRNPRKKRSSSCLLLPALGRGCWLLRVCGVVKWLGPSSTRPRRSWNLRSL